MPRLIDNLSTDVRDDLAELAMKLAANQDTRKPFLNAVKKVDPNRRFPSQEVEDLREELKADREAEKEARKLEREREETERRLEAQRKGLLRKFSEEQVAEIESVMTKYGISDYEAGADLYQARKPAPPPTSPSATWEFPTLEGLLDDPTKAARNEAHRVITELKQGRAA